MSASAAARRQKDGHAPSEEALDSQVKRSSRRSRFMFFAWGCFAIFCRPPPGTTRFRMMRRFNVTGKPYYQSPLGEFARVRHRHRMTCLAPMTCVAPMTRPAAAFAALVVISLAPGDAGAIQAMFDGQWSVLIVTEKGRCDRAYRYPVRIENGTVGYAGTASFNISAAGSADAAG